jgi:hypothetical protein
MRGEFVSAEVEWESRKKTGCVEQRRFRLEMQAEGVLQDPQVCPMIFIRQVFVV